MAAAGFACNRHSALNPHCRGEQFRPAMQARRALQSRTSKDFGFGATGKQPPRLSMERRVAFFRGPAPTTEGKPAVRERVTRRWVNGEPVTDT
jgi:hypothetical protein